MDGKTGGNHGMQKRRRKASEEMIKSELSEFSEQDVYKIAAEIIQRRGLIFEKDLFETSAIKLKPKNVSDLFANLFWIIRIYEAIYNVRELEREIKSLK